MRAWGLSHRERLALKATKVFSLAMLPRFLTERKISMVTSWMWHGDSALVAAQKCVECHSLSQTTQWNDFSKASTQTPTWVRQFLNCGHETDLFCLLEKGSITVKKQSVSFDQKKNYKQAVISCLSRNYLLPFFTFLVVYVGFLSVIATTKQHFFNSEDHFCEYVHHEHRHGSTSTHMAVKKCQHRQSVGRQPPPHNHWWRLLEVYVHTNNSMLLI